jgi:hypothetical protein
MTTSTTLTKNTADSSYSSSSSSSSKSSRSSSCNNSSINSRSSSNSNNNSSSNNKDNREEIDLLSDSDVERGDVRDEDVTSEGHPKEGHSRGRHPSEASVEGASDQEVMATCWLPVGYLLATCWLPVGYLFQLIFPSFYRNKIVSLSSQFWVNPNLANLRQPLIQVMAAAALHAHAAIDKREASVQAEASGSADIVVDPNEARLGLR